MSKEYFLKKGDVYISCTLRLCYEKECQIIIINKPRRISVAFVQDIYHIRFYFFCKNGNLNFHCFGCIIDTFVTFLTAKIEEYFIRMEIRQCQSNCEVARYFYA